MGLGRGVTAMMPRSLGIKPLRAVGVDLSTGLHPTAACACLLWASVGGAHPLPLVTAASVLTTLPLGRAVRTQGRLFTKEQSPLGTGGGMGGVETFGFFPNKHVSSLRPSKVGMDGRMAGIGLLLAVHLPNIFEGHAAWF